MLVVAPTRSGGKVILHLNFEEIRALRAGGRALLEAGAQASSAVLAPSVSRAVLEAFLPRLEGDLSLSTLSEVRRAERAVGAILDHLLVEMETAVVATHAADELAVAAYFDWAHALTVSARLADMATEMEAVIELVTGEEPDEGASRTFGFPD